MKITRTPTGLIMTPDLDDRDLLRRSHRKLGAEATEHWWLKKQGLKQVRPEDAGALTSAPLIEYENEVYGFMDYAVKSFLEELKAGNDVFWQKG